MQDSSHAVWIAYLLPLLAIFVPSAITWARDLSAQARRMRTLDECKKIVDFWDSWTKATIAAFPAHRCSYEERHCIIEEVSRGGRVHFERAARIASRIYTDEREKQLRKYRFTFREFQEYRKGLNWFRRAFLLYRPATPWSARYQRLAQLMPAVLIAEVIVFTLRRLFWKTSMLPAEAQFTAILNRFLEPHLVLFSLSLLIVLPVLSYTGWLLLATVHKHLIASENNPTYYLWEEDPERKGMRRPVKEWD